MCAVIDQFHLEVRKKIITFLHIMFPQIKKTVLYALTANPIQVKSKQFMIFVSAFH